MKQTILLIIFLLTTSCSGMKISRVKSNTISLGLRPNTEFLGHKVKLIDMTPEYLFVDLVAKAKLTIPDRKVGAYIVCVFYDRNKVIGKVRKIAVLKRGIYIVKAIKYYKTKSVRHIRAGFLVHWKRVNY